MAFSLFLWCSGLLVSEHVFMLSFGKSSAGVAIQAMRRQERRKERTGSKVEWLPALHSLSAFGPKSSLRKDE